MPKATSDDLWVYIYEQGKVRTRDLENHFVKTKTLARGTMYKYKRQLELEGKILAKPVSGRPPYNVYFVPEQHHRECEALKQYKQLSPTYFSLDSNDIPEAFYPNAAVRLNIHKLEWEDAPPGLFFTDVKRKVLWTNDETGALVVLQKFPLGFIESMHYHPDCNQWGLGLTGEVELPDGTRMSMEGIFCYFPSGKKHMQPKVTKETLAFCYFDGPRTKISVSD